MSIIFDLIKMKKAIIDVETLEVWDSVTECAEALGISRPAVHQSIIRNGRCGGGKKSLLLVKESLNISITGWKRTPSRKRKDSRGKTAFFGFERKTE